MNDSPDRLRETVASPAAAGGQSTARIRSIVRELRILLPLAGPVILTQVSQMGMGVVDTIMAGRVSAVDLAGVALGGNFYWPTLLLLSGVIMSLTPTVAQLNGAGKLSEAGTPVRQSLWIALLGGGLLVAFLNNVEPLYGWIGVDARAVPVAVGYLQAMSFAVIPALGYFSLRYLCEGTAWTLPAMLIAAAAFALKIPLNLLFIHGGLGVPAMGGVGCGWATAIIINLQLLAMILVVQRSRVRASGVFERFEGPHLAEIGRLVRLGLPIGITMFLEISMFSAVTLLIGRLGVDAVAAHQIAGNVGAMTFMVPLGIGMAASIRVGFNVGAGDHAAARRSGQVALGLAVVFAVLAALLVLVLRGTIAGLYSTEAAVVGLAVDLLLFVVLYQFFDDTQVVAVGALRGFKDTRTPMWIAIVSYWCVGLPVGLAASEGWLGIAALEGVRGFWFGLLAGLGAAAVVLLTRFHWLSHRPERVLDFSGR